MVPSRRMGEGRCAELGLSAEGHICTRRATSSGARGQSFYAGRVNMDNFIARGKRIYARSVLHCCNILYKCPFTGTHRLWHPINKKDAATIRCASRPSAAQVSIHQLLPEIARMPTGGVCSHVNRKCEEKNKKKGLLMFVTSTTRRKKCMRRNAMLTS